MALRFRDRADAGRQLARALSGYSGSADVIVLGLPRGGIPVAFEVARALGAPLDVLVVRKLGLPRHEELAMGAIASGGAKFLNEDVINLYGITKDEIDHVIASETRELARRERQYRGDRLFPDLTHRTVILVDDGLATGSSMRVAVKTLRQERPAKIAVAVPVAADETCEAFRDLADDVICAATPEPFYAVGLWYDDFSQTTDEEVHELIGRAKAPTRTMHDGPARADASPRG